MDADNSTHTAAGSDDGAPPSARGWLRIDPSVVPAAAVVAVAVASVTTAVMMSRQEASERNTRPAVAAARSQPAVKAPPQVVKAPPLRSPATHAAGAGPGCRNCGVVESVTSSRPSTYQLRVRMDDGTLKLVEQRAAFPAGSRVVLEGGTLKAAPQNG